MAAAIAIGGCHRHSPLLDPTVRELAWTAPDSFVVSFETSRGTFEVAAHRDWSPLGVDRFHFLVHHHYYDGARFFRMIPGFVVQWGIAGDPRLNQVWSERTVPDEPVRRSNARGFVSYARGGPNTRGVQLYVNLGNNARLDTLNTFGFPPVATVTRGIEIADSLYAGYSCRRGSQNTCPDQDSINAKGNSYLERAFPKLDFIKVARVVKEWRSK